MRHFIHSILFLMCAVTLTFAGPSAAEPSATPVAETKEIVVAVTGGRVRQGPDLESGIVRESTIGTRFTVLGEKNGWSRVSLGPDGDGEEPAEGWISNTIVVPYDAARPGAVYQQIVGKYLKRESIPFKTAVEIFEFLPRAADEAKTYEVGGDLRLKRLLMLGEALRRVPIGKENESPYREFLEKYRDDVVFSEPAASWYVNSERFWELHQRYRRHKIAEEIAWHAAGNPTPGECEGYINCHLYRLRVTHGEYLNFYPNGRYSREALRDVHNLLQPIVEDLPVRSVYYTASDISDRAEFNSMLADLRKIISKSPHLEKTKILKQINQIAEGHR